MTISGGRLIQDWPAPSRTAVTRRSPTFLCLLLAAALFVRALLPQGYMPERSADGGIAVALCGSDGIWLIPLTEEAPEGKGQRADQPCAFAGLSAAAGPPHGVPGLAPRAPVAPVYAERSVSHPTHRTVRFLPPATGPPLAA